MLESLPFWLEQGVLLMVALLANGLSALAGGGAGLLQLPALLFLGLPFTTALATHKIATVALGIGAGFRHAQNRSLELKFSLFVLFAGLPGVISGAYFIVDVPHEWATSALGVLTIGLGVYSFLSKDLGLNYASRNRDTRGYIVGALALSFIGVLNGALASGTGLFVTLCLVLWFGLDYKRAVAYTLVLVGIVWNGSGAAVLAWRAEVQWTWLIPLLLGSFLGGYLGTHLGIAKGNTLIKRVFECVTVIVGLSLFFS